MELKEIASSYASEIQMYLRIHSMELKDHLPAPVAPTGARRIHSMELKVVSVPQHSHNPNRHRVGIHSMELKVNSSEEIVGEGSCRDENPINGIERIYFHPDFNR